ncbi:MAG: CCA-adding enzyme [Methanomassiliicoccales archaeon PtaU1.Bin030]|nr:MAG: CCA-adding enzyme [Methanomassiliicoccales archaeon PtaU1.Bin030]
MVLEDDVLKKISPTPERRKAIQGSVNSLLARTKEEADKEGLGLRVSLVGSVAKDTFLREPDIDIFILFPETVSRDRLEAVGLAIGKRILRVHEERYAEHPYVHGEWDGLEVDLVPCYQISDTALLRSAVDRTPFHTKYVQSHLREEQKGEVRLLKQFAKGIGVYGAEAKVQGFSGYLLELLVMKYGNFREVLEASAAWTRGTALSLEGEGTKKFDEPFIFYDPVDNKRNVASALSPNCLALFIFASQAYLKGPSELFFFPRQRKPLELDVIRSMLDERGSGLLLVRMERPALIDDNLYPQVRRSLDGICALLSSHDFRVIDGAYHVAEDLSFVLELEELVLSRGRRHSGPPAWIENASSFLERWGKKGLSRPFLEGGHWMVVAPRDHPSADDLIKVKLYTAALGSDIRKHMAAEVLMGAEVLTEENRPLLSALLDKRMSWEV